MPEHALSREELIAEASQFLGLGYVDEICV
jgi:hypothetical protein